MKREDFITKLKSLGYNTHISKSCIAIMDIKQDLDESEMIAMVGEESVASIDTRWRGFQELTNNDSQKLLNLIVEYTSTPLEDRKEKKKYYIKHKYLKTLLHGYDCLNYYVQKDKWFISDKEEDIQKGSTYKAKFTLDELPEWVHEELEKGHLIKEEVK